VITSDKEIHDMDKDETQLIHADLTYAIRGVLFKVGNRLWPGLPEDYFQRAVSIDLTKLKIPHSVEEQFHVTYRGVEVGRYYCDLVVDGKVILELKVVPALTDLHRAQLISYLRVTDADVGLLVNLAVPRLRSNAMLGFMPNAAPTLPGSPSPLMIRPYYILISSGGCTSVFTGSTMNSALAFCITSIGVRHKSN
jgi:GxxExxY protein